MKNNITNKEIKQFYEDVIPVKFNNEYEFNRWFKSSRARSEYSMMHRAITSDCGSITFDTCLELGPGPGTWTKLLFKICPNATFDLVDISETMRGQFISEMRGGLENVNYHVSDIMEYDTDKLYDFFFSSRAVEYIEDKESFVKKINGILKSGANGCIITKNPKFGGILESSDRRVQHGGQISIEALQEILSKQGFENIKVYPAVIQLPGMLSRLGCVANFLCEKIQSRYIHRSLLDSGWLLTLTESYIIKFSKK